MKPARTVAAVLALVATGCGVGTQDTARPIDRAAVPFHLLAPASTTTTAAATGTANVVVYLAGNSRLAPVPRRVPAPVTVPKALAVLGDGPTSAESSAGLESPVSSAAPLQFAGMDGSVALVDVPTAFADLGGQSQIVAAAQIVYTLVEFPGVGSVELRVGGQSAEVPTADGTLSQGPLTRADYQSLAPL